MKIKHRDVYTQKTTETAGVSYLVDRVLQPWDHRGIIEDTEYRVEKLQELVVRLIEVTATRLEFNADELSKILMNRIEEVEYETPVE